MEEKNFNETCVPLNGRLRESLHDTIVVTSVDTLKEAFMRWSAEMERRRGKGCEGQTMVDEPTVLRMLGKSRTTLWRWNNLGYLPCHKLGGKNCYRLADVERVRTGKTPGDEL